WSEDRPGAGHGPWGIRYYVRGDQRSSSGEFFSGGRMQSWQGMFGIESLLYSSIR
ncbi:unnamed protein product, partial [marine sediment metagenome]